MPPEVLGPLGLTVALGIAVGALWRDHLRADADDRAQRDRALDVSTAQVEAINRVAAGQDQLAGEVGELAGAFREYIREQSSRRRQSDGR